MKDTIKITIPFSFKGEDHSPSSIIDLDIFDQKKFTPETLAHMVATENKIGNYSYEYEVLQSSEQYFSEATGLAKKYLDETHFNFIAYKIEINQLQALATLQQIAKDSLGINDLENHPDILLALQQALDAGRSSANGEQ